MNHHSAVCCPQFIDVRREWKWSCTGQSNRTSHSTTNDFWSFNPECFFRNAESLVFVLSKSILLTHYADRFKLVQYCFPAGSIKQYHTGAFSTLYLFDLSFFLCVFHAHQGLLPVNMDLHSQANERPKKSQCKSVHLFVNTLRITLHRIFSDLPISQPSCVSMTVYQTLG